MDEKKLVELFKKGDRSAFNELVLKYQNTVMNIAFGMLSVREDAEDAAQEVFLKIYKNISAFNENSTLSTWIYRITVNTCNDILRKRIKGKTVSIYPDNDDDSEIVIPDTSHTPEEAAQASEIRRQLLDAIAGLKEEYRTVITLFDLEGMSYDEISKIVNIPVGTVKSRLSRARGQLRKNLEHLRELFF